MTELAKKILLVFADAYPTSAHYKGGRSLRKGGWDLLFPSITTDVNAKEEFLDAVEELVDAKILHVRWRRFHEGDQVDALYLDDPPALFAAIGRKSPESAASEMLAQLDETPWADRASGGVRLSGAAADRLAHAAAYLRPRLEAGHPVPVATALDLADIGRLLALSRDEALARPIRALSVRLFGDSKRLERLLPVADRLVCAAGLAPISEELRLVRSYPEVTIALFGRIFFAGGREAWHASGDVIGMPEETVARIRSIELDPPRESAASTAHPLRPAVLSIENKESFYVMAGRFADHARERTPAWLVRDGNVSLTPSALVYTAGHPNGAVVALLKLLEESGAAFHHYGDLDPDGILILQELSSALGIDVAPILMNRTLHRRFARYGYTLDAAQRARLSLVRADAPAPIAELAHEIAQTGIGVEQEIIDWESPTAGASLPRL